MPSIKLDSSFFNFSVRFTLDNLSQYFSQPENAPKKHKHTRSTDSFGNGWSLRATRTERNGQGYSLGVYLDHPYAGQAQTVNCSIRGESLMGEQYWDKHLSEPRVFTDGVGSWGFKECITSKFWTENKMLQEEDAVVITAIVQSYPSMGLISPPILNFIHQTISSDKSSSTDFIVFSKRRVDDYLTWPRTFHVDQSLVSKSSVVLKKYFLDESTCGLIRRLAHFNESGTPTNVETDYCDSDSDFEDDEDVEIVDVIEEQNESGDDDLGLTRDDENRPTSRASDGMQVDMSDSSDLSSIVDDPPEAGIATKISGEAGEDKNSKAEPISPVLALGASDGPYIAHNDTHVVTGAASATWEALLYYLYTGVVQFAPLRSEGEQIRQSFIDDFVSKNPQRPAPCSCKSMYRLAVEMELDELKEHALTYLKSRLSKRNIVTEVFSIFTSRYQEVQKIEFAVLMQHRDASNESVIPISSAMLGEIMGGAYPHAGWVLTESLKRVAVTAAA